METENLSFVAIVGLVAVVAVVALLGNQGTATVMTPMPTQQAAPAPNVNSGSGGNAVGNQGYNSIIDHNNEWDKCMGVFNDYSTCMPILLPGWDGDNV